MVDETRNNARRRRRGCGSTPPPTQPKSRRLLLLLRLRLDGLYDGGSFAAYRDLDRDKFPCLGVATNFAGRHIQSPPSWAVALRIGVAGMEYESAARGEDAAIFCQDMSSL